MPHPDHVLRIKVTLLDVKPPIWRRIEVHDQTSFWGLHVAIQDAMGWLDCHLHQFTYPRSVDPDRELRIGIPYDDPGTATGWMVPVADVLTLAQRRVIYEYDFGDGWQHEVRLEQVRPMTKEESASCFPRCLAGRRACPIEDIGGPWGYEEALETWKAAGGQVEDDEDRASMIPPDFDPERFDPKAVRFSDSSIRLAEMAMRL